MTRLDTTPRQQLRAEKARRSETGSATGSRNRSNDAAQDAFIARKAEIDAMLARLQALSADHFNTDPDALTWSDVGTLEHYARLIRRVTDDAFAEGENAG